MTEKKVREIKFTLLLRLLTTQKKNQLKKIPFLFSHKKNSQAKNTLGELPKLPSPFVSLLFKTQSIQ